MAQQQERTPGQRVLLYGVEWNNYNRLLHSLEGCHLRITYDHGALEMRKLSHGHQHRAHLLGRLVDVVTEALDLLVKGGGSTTFRRRKYQCGLEADECYWIANESRVRSLDQIDLRKNPPPDLALEVDISSSLNRMRIYAALQVPEVWRWDGKALTFHHLGADGRYSVQPTSRSFPQLKPDDLLPFLALRGQLDDNGIVRQFQGWVQGRFLQGNPGAAAP